MQHAHRHPAHQDERTSAPFYSHWPWVVFPGDGARPTIYPYNFGPYALQHARGCLDEYLAHLDHKLSELQRPYRTASSMSMNAPRRTVGRVVGADESWHAANHHSIRQYAPAVDKRLAEGR